MTWSEQLAGFGAAWDQARRDQAVAGRRFETDDIGITSEFEGGNGTDIGRIGPDHYFVRCEPDPGSHPFSGRSYYFCLAVQNRRPLARRITLRVEAAGWNHFGFQSRHVVLRRGARRRVDGAEACTPVRANGERDTLDVELRLPGGHEPDPVVVVSKFHWTRHTELQDWLAGLPSDRARQVPIGTSRNGLPITAIEIGDIPDASEMVIAQTSQPSELAAALVIRGLVEHLLQDTAHAARLRDSVGFRIVPMPNPDGNRAGLLVGDIAGYFPGHEADRVARGDPDTPPETRALWRYLAERPPAMFLEWHSNNWSRRPGHMLLRYGDGLIADRRRRATWIALEDAFLRMPETHHENVTTRTEGVYQNTMGFQTAVELGAISTRIKTHEKVPIDVSISHGIGCLELAVAALLRM